MKEPMHPLWGPEPVWTLWRKEDSHFTGLELPITLSRAYLEVGSRVQNALGISWFVLPVFDTAVTEPVASR